MATLHDLVTEAVAMSLGRELTDMEKLVQTCLMDVMPSVTGAQARDGAVAVIAMLGFRPGLVDDLIARLRTPADNPSGDA